MLPEHWFWVVLIFIGADFQGAAVGKRREMPISQVELAPPLIVLRIQVFVFILMSVYVFVIYKYTEVLWLSR